MKNYYPLIIIGSGVAGLSAAMTADELGIGALVISKEEIGQGNSRYAQGGIIFADPTDQSLADDFKCASSATASQAMVDLIVDRSGEMVKHLLIDLAKVPFERDSVGQLKLTKEGAHSIPRILFKGDYSGRAIVESMATYLQTKARTITFLNNYCAIELIKEENQVVAVRLINALSGESREIFCSQLILATGGCAGLYLNTSNYPGAKGEGMGMAIAAGAEVRDLEFIQFHPTTLYLEKSNLRFLLTEALRGEGAILRNCKGERFMPRYHPEAELASRDKVSQAIVEEMRQTSHPCVYLDISHFSADHFATRFPTIAQKLIEYGVDYNKNGIPVVPSAHFTCGGVVTDEWGRVPAINNLYAVGEVACTGLHGANRLASSALLEGLMMGARAVSKLSGEKLTPPTSIEIAPITLSSKSVDLMSHYQQLSALLWQNVGIERKRDQLVEALQLISQWKEQAQATSTADQRSWINSLLVAEAITRLSLERKESIGCFLKHQ